MKRLLLTISLILTGVILAPSAFAIVGATSFETKDGVTAPTDGDLVESTGDGTGWSGNWIADLTLHDYDNGVGAPTGGGTWVAQELGDRGLRRAYATTQSSGNQIVYLRRTGTGNSAGFTFLDGALTTHWRLNIGQGAGTDIVIAGATTEICLASFALNTWYKNEVEFDVAANTARCRTNDGTWSATVGREGGSGNIAQVAMLTDAGATTYFDFLQDNAPVAAAPAKNQGWFFLFPLSLQFIPLPKRI